MECKPNELRRYGLFHLVLVCSSLLNTYERIIIIGWMNAKIVLDGNFVHTNFLISKDCVK